jgi:PhnB protein
MPDKVDYRPANVTTVTPYLSVRGASAAIDFYKRAFGAEELFRMAEADGRIGHATIRIGDSTVYLADETTGWKSPQTIGGSPMTLHMYVPDCDATWKRATDAGGKVVVPLADHEWGDRYGQLEDPFGHLWAIATTMRQAESQTPG